MSILENERSVEESKTDNQFFRILSKGPFSPEDIIYNYDPVPIDYPDSVKQRVSAEWQKVIKNNPSAFPGPLVRLNDFEKNNDKLLLKLGPTSYDEYRGTVVLTENERRKINYQLANPLASCILVYSDTVYGSNRAILFSIRGSELVHRPNVLEIPSGNVSINQGLVENPIQTAVRECEEEQGIYPEELENLQIDGLIYEHYKDAAAMLVCSARLKDSVAIDTIKARKIDSEGTPVWLPTKDLQDLSNLLINLSPNILPAALAAYYFYLLNNFPVNISQNFIDRLKTQTYGEVSAANAIRTFLLKKNSYDLR